MGFLDNYTCNGTVGIIYLNNPPVNGLSLEVRKHVAAALKVALEDPRVSAIVLTGKGDIFCGGADIREFNTLAGSQEPILRDLIAQLEASPKPLIAAINGVAFGGGLELALGCNYRVAAPSARMALPEVKLGLIPGAGGTQRLPRLVGLAQALTMITTGDPVDAVRARTIGLLDEVIEGDFLSGAIEFAGRVAATRRTHPVVGCLQVKVDGNAEDSLSAVRMQMAKAKRGLTAPQECISCIEQSLRLPIQEGLEFEKSRFQSLLSGTESAALRHLFFAEREAGKVIDLPKSTKTRPIRSVGVVGAGTMGSGIAMCFANAGIPAVIVESKPEAIDRGLAHIRKTYASAREKGKLSEADVACRMDLLTMSLEMTAVSDADLVVEAVFEDMAVKKDVFRQLDSACKPGCILATNTSRLDIDEIATSTSRPQDVIGLHFFSPANVMRLVEVVKGAQTSREAIATAMALTKALQKIGVLVSVCEGFVGNRMLTAYVREAGFLLEEGASPAQVDKALTAFGMAMGPFTMLDMAGLDVAWAARKRQAATRRADLRYSSVADRICELGRYGQKTGSGYYRYEAGSRTPLPDPAIDELIEDCAKGSGIARKGIADAEIVERTIFALINEGARILEDGIAQRASDIDVVYTSGYGFPTYRGGPMFYADAVGLDVVYGAIAKYHELYGEYWKPARLLERLASERKRFSDL